MRRKEMNKISKDNTFIVARVSMIHKNQLDELAVAESRTKSSMIRCLIERAYKKLIRNYKGEENERSNDIFR